MIVKNREYYEAGLIALKEVSFLLTGEATTATNLYKSGQADLIQGVGLPTVVLPTLSRKRDFRTAPAFGTYFPCFNIKQAPFDNVLVRHAFNMAVDKNAIVNVFGGGRIAAQSLVPPLTGYTRPKVCPFASRENLRRSQFQPCCRTRTSRLRRLSGRTGFQRP